MPPQTIRNDFFRWEIVITLLFKAILIYALWVTFFHHPQDRPLTSDDVSRLFFGKSPATTSVSDNRHQEETN